MKKDVIIRSILLAVVISLIAVQAYTLDYPHHDLNNIQCDSCHFVYDGQPSLLPPWTEHEPQDIDDTAYNTLCWSCHNDIDAPYQRTHSSLQIDNSYGYWSVECRTCHNPHKQDQLWVYDAASALYSGEVDSFTETTMTKTNDAVVWETDEYAGAILVPNISSTRKKYGYQILSNTGDTLTVSGPMTTSRITVGGTFAIIYGKLVKNEISLDDIIDPTTPPPKEGVMTVRFFGPTGTNSFADGTGLFDGVCEVCHTLTTHFRNDGSGAQQNHDNLDSGKQGFDCIDCHSHLNGFAHGGGGGGGGDGSGCSGAAGCHQDQDSHPTHLNGGLDLGATPCLTCHMYDNFPRFADDQDILGTTICVNCHSADGLDLAKQYWENPGSSAGEPGSWLAEEGEESFCGSCHDETPGNTARDGSGDPAPNIAGNKSTYGFFITGHGKTSGNYPGLSWQAISAVGNPAANKSCNECHDLSTDHFNNAADRLKAGFENDDNNTNCRQCHDPGTVATADPQWYTTYSAYGNSAHGTEKCSDCHNVHGASGPYRGMTRAEHENLCYQCHTEGGVQNFGVAGYTGTHNGGDNQSVLIDSMAGFPNANVYLYNGWRVYNLTDGSSGTIVSSGYDSTHIPATLSGGAENDWDDGDEYHIAYVDDIQQAFGLSEKHNLGTTFTRGSGNYTLECISCHNVHIVTGKHWKVDEGLSPVTRFIDNTSVWGDGAGEKMDDFAAGGSGTGGFYYKAAQGYQLGATGLPFDSGGAYRPPKKGSGYDLEFGGDVLPDYTSLCLDCHTYRMSDANPPVNWGQGIGCTDNSVDPPDQRIECGADHGLGVAGKPYYVSDSGTAGFWGASGNPDVLFDMNYVTRGRHNGHFMRWPYDSADRGAGINFVMSCTDCHEAHGASGPSMLRPAVNNYTPGTSTWNTFCNACHYYYGGQHAGMSCGNASCHEANSIHRIIHTTNSGGTQLMLTASGYEAEYQQPDFTPQIVSVDSDIGSSELTVTFDNGVWANMDLTGVLEPEDFWLFDKNSDNPRTITNVIHTSGSSTATLIMNNPLIADDLYVDTLAMKPASVWNWYDGGYVNWATGTIEAQAVSGGPWPVTISGPSRVEITTVEGLTSYDELYVTFSEAAYANNDSSGDLQPSDFIFVDTDNGRSIVSVQHTAGESSAILTLSAALDVNNDVGFDTLSAFNDSIYGTSGIPAATDTVTVTDMPSPVISSVEGAVGSSMLMITFSDSVYTDKGMSGALQTADLVLTDTDDGRTIASIDHIAGGLTAILTLSSAMDDTDDFLVDSVASMAGSIFGETDYPVGTTPVAITEQPAPQIVAVTGQVDYDRLEVRFNTAVYSDTGMTGSLQPSDFIIEDSDNGRTITAVEHTPGVESSYIKEDIAWLTLSSPLDSADDIDVDTISSNGIYNFIDAPVDTTPVIITEMPAAVITAVEGAVGSHKLKVTFSHWVFGDVGKAGTLQPEDFVLTDTGGNNPRTIQSVDHSVGDAWAYLTTNEALSGVDIDADTINAAAASIYNSADHPVPTTAVTISAAAAPAITSVEGTEGLDEILVLFSEAVYADLGVTGDLQASDFILTDEDNLRSITGVDHTAGSASAILTLSSPLDSSADIGTDNLAANGIYNSMDVAVDTSPVILSGNNCPVGGTRFEFDESSGSATVADGTGLLTGAVGNPTISILGDGFYTGDETEAELTYIDLNNEDQCLKTPRALTLETRIYFGSVDLDYVDISPANGIDDDYDAGLPSGNECCSKDGDGRNTTATRIAERLDAWQFTVFRGNWSTTDAFVPDRARIIFKYRVTDRGYCDGTYPGDPTVENGAWFKQISSDIENYPIVQGHWYKIRIVFNTDKPRLAVDIFADDQGTDGSDTGELWSGYRNVSRPDPEDSSACKWAAIPGLVMNTDDNTTSIGDNTVHTRPGQDDQGDYRNSTLKGKLDWFEWKPVVDYSGINDPPY